MANSLIERHFIAAKGSYFLFGPRGTGKSTLMRYYYPDALYIDLLDPSVFRQYTARPERLEMLVQGENKKTIIIDEIQKIPTLLSVVHRLIEQKKGWQFILTGSSARQLKRAGVDLLAGRAVIRMLHPFMASELNEQFVLDRALEYGLVPLIMESQEVKDTLNSYIDVYLNEEVKAEGLVRNIGDFSRFLEIMSFSHGCVLNMANVARECEVSRKLVEGYLSVLQDLLLSVHLPVFSERAKRKLISRSKFYYFDAGVYRGLRSVGYLDRPSEVDGPGLEGLVLQHLRAWNDYQSKPNKLYYWRTRHGVEVDFIVYGPNCFYAIEVKNAKQVYSKDMKGLKTFREDYPNAILLLLHRGNEILLIDGVKCLPVEKFLRQLTPGRALWS
ncbi:MAG: ATP-binding protein [Gammaproteobacteria bacterium]